VGDLDDRHAGGVQAGDDIADLLDGELVGDSVRAVAQRGVDDPDHASSHLRGASSPAI
jgi:hypothetical protein